MPPESAGKCGIMKSSNRIKSKSLNIENRDKHEIQISEIFRYWIGRCEDPVKLLDLVLIQIKGLCLIKGIT